MSRKTKIILIIITVVFLGYFAILRLEEDTWICRQGQWIKHGVPSAPKPEEGCTWISNFIPFK